MTPEGYDIPLPPVGAADNAPVSQPTILERYGISPILFGFLVLLLIFILYQVVGGVITLLLIGLKPAEGNVVVMRLATGIGQIVFMLVPTIILARVASASPLQYLRIRTPDIRTLILPLFGIFSLQQLLQIYMVFQDRLPWPEGVQKLIQQFKDMFEQIYRMLVSSSSIPELFFVVIIVALIPAVSEELMFRGLVQRSFEKGSTPVRGMVLTGVIFGAYHLNPFTIIPLAALGIYLGFLTMRANNVWVSVAAHFYNNLFACIAVYLHMDEDGLVTGDPMGMPVGVLLGSFVAFALIFIAATTYFLRITGDERRSPDVNTLTL